MSKQQNLDQKIWQALLPSLEQYLDCESWRVQLYHSLSQLQWKALTALPCKPILVETRNRWSSCHEFGKSAIWIKFLHERVFAGRSLTWCAGYWTHTDVMESCMSKTTCSALKMEQWAHQGSGASTDFRRAASCYTIHLLQPLKLNLLQLTNAQAGLGFFFACFLQLFVKRQGWLLDSKSLGRPLSHPILKWLMTVHKPLSPNRISDSHDILK